jgi:hypothetical protein
VGLLKTPCFTRPGAPGEGPRVGINQAVTAPTAHLLPPNFAFGARVRQQVNGGGQLTWELGP